MNRGQTAANQFWLHIDTAETTTKVYDTLTMQVQSSTGAALTTLATYSNLNEHRLRIEDFRRQRDKVCREDLLQKH